MSPTRHTRRIHPYLPPPLHQRLVDHCATRGVTESAVITEALTLHLNGLSDPALLYRRLDRLTRALDRADRELGLLSHSFALFVRVWFAHTQRVPKELRAAAVASAEKRYREFLDAVAARITSGKRFLDDLPQDQIAGPDELAAIANGSLSLSSDDESSGPPRGSSSAS